MTKYDLQRQAIIVSIHARLQGMIVENAERQDRQESPAYGYDHFKEKADELINVASCNDVDLRNYLNQESDTETAPLPINPGEWRVQHSNSQTAWNVLGTTPGLRHKIAMFPYSQDPQLPVELNQREKLEQYRNAVLSSAAPRLLNMLESLVLFLSDSLPIKCVPLMLKEYIDQSQELINEISFTHEN